MWFGSFGYPWIYPRVIPLFAINSLVLTSRHREDRFGNLIFNYLKMDLHDAVKHNDIERVRLLVEQGADKDKDDSSNGQTPLFWASLTGYLEVAQYLVEQGAALDKASNGDETPLIDETAGRLRRVDPSHCCYNQWSSRLSSLPVRARCRQRQGR